jgi:non-ribosomal peptide synthetase component F
LFFSLLNGALLHIPAKLDIKDVSVIKQKIVALSITHLHATPKYLIALGEIEDPHCLKRVISGGEAISTDLVPLWGRLLMNSYGPTESTVTSIQAPQYGQDGVLNNIGQWITLQFFA